MAKLDQQTAIEKLDRAMGEIDDVKNQPAFSQEFNRWKRDTEVAVRHVFGEHSRHVQEFNDVRYHNPNRTLKVGNSLFGHAPRSQNELTKTTSFFIAGLETARSLLQSMIKEIGEYGLEESSEVMPMSTSHSMIFIIHGHDSGLKESVARFLERVGLMPIILHEQPDQGRTIIEKFNDYSDVSFAIALFTPDDLGTSVKEPNNLKGRARQNVVLEFGFFLGKLGRHRACALVGTGVEIPSDLSGVLYIPVDEGGYWRTRLMGELKAAGFDIDANVALY